MFDAHTHLNSDQLFPDREQHVVDFIKAWWTWLINIWVNNAWNQRWCDIQKMMPSLLETHGAWDFFYGTTIGLHPWETTFGNITSQEAVDLACIELSSMVKKHNTTIVAIGECGIDSHFERNDTIESLQTQLFIYQCDLAREMSLPLVIHSRDNYDLTQEILQAYTDLDIYFHCRGYTDLEIEKAAKQFPSLWIWFCGNLTYPKAWPLRESFAKAKELGIDIILETDAPYLSPQVVRGRQNTPAHISHLYDFVHKTFDMPAQTFIENTKKLYRL
jgi:TatD DNase family protein